MGISSNPKSVCVGEGEGERESEREIWVFPEITKQCDSLWRCSGKFDTK